MATIARQLAEYAHQLSFGDLDRKIVHEVKRRTLDALGGAIAAFDSPMAQLLWKLTDRSTTNRGATVWGSGTKTVPTLAAFANGALLRYRDLVETYVSRDGGHPSDNIPAVMAAAELTGADGQEVITAILLAYEVHCRLLDAGALQANGWDHDSYAPFPVALAAGKLMGLSVDQLEQAVNLAGINSPQLGQTFQGQVSLWKNCTFADGARNGIFAACLAAEGMTGPDQIFEGKLGFCQKVSGTFSLDASFFGSDQHSCKILASSLKVWPCVVFVQSAVDAALQLREELGGADGIEKVDVFTYDLAREISASQPEHWQPATREGADHSLPYCVAAALADGTLGLEQFSDARRSDPDLLALIGKIAVHPDPLLNAGYPQGFPCRVVITTNESKVLAREVSYPLGHPSNPMSDERLKQKFLFWASQGLPEPQIKKIARLVWELDLLPDLQQLTSSLVLPENDCG
jgi:2-methylcitrate dehydratase